MNQIKYFEDESKNLAENEAEGDLDIYLSILQTYDHTIELQESLRIEARKILFCAIFSYYESMLNRIKKYYQLLEGTKIEQIVQMHERFIKEFEERYSEKISHIDMEKIHNINTSFSYLRNFFMHGELSNPEKEKKLFAFVEQANYIRLYGKDLIEITDDQFLYNALNVFKEVLVSLEQNFSEKSHESKEKITTSKTLM